MNLIPDFEEIRSIGNDSVLVHSGSHKSPHWFIKSSCRVLIEVGSLPKIPETKYTISSIASDLPASI
ncbi:hypothetical protein L2E82_02886 [Cichorium intybus]|uniref:Uncharacterized protein n=1 Tax=Cichorium intybus TaxID=13427 RepID=A0ACB9H2L3_CICIN|nr:hypothetical protein L2E82_02886 [Cichorium intybus]